MSAASSARTGGGILAPVTTPFDPKSGNVDLDAFRRNLMRLLEAGLSGILVAGSTGEAPLLDFEEQRRLVESARSVIPADRWLLAGTGAESTRQTIALSRAAAADGADAVLVRPPGYFAAAHSPASLADHFRAVADASPIPVLVYNIPKYTHLQLAPALLQGLVGHPNIIGAKDSSGDMTNLAAYRHAAPEWTIYVGSGSFIYPALEMGCDGGIVGVACYAAGLAVEVFTTFRSGERTLAASLQQRLQPLDKEIVGKLGPAGIKAAMDAVGLEGGPVRPPLAPVTAADRERITALLAGERLHPPVATR